MWNFRWIARRLRLSASSLNRASRADGTIKLVILAIFGGAVTLAIAVIGQSDAKSSDPKPDATPANLAVSRGAPDDSRSADRPRIDNPLWAITIKNLAATQERPLFTPSRRPPSPPPVLAPSSAPAPPPKPAERERPALLLIGTVAGETGAIGVFLDQSSNRTITLRTGQGHDGWVLSAVHKREVILQKDQDVALLSLSAHAIAPVAAAAPVSRLDREQHGRR